MCNLLCMYGWIYMCWIFILKESCDIFAMIIVGYKKNRIKKRRCRLFAVHGRRQRPLCHRWQTAKGAHGAHLCFLRDGPFGKFAYRGGRQSQANGKDFAFAVRRADGKKERALTYS